jgi:hypothetical protein
MAFNLAMFLNDPKTTIAWGATAGFLAGLGWVAMGIGIVSLFERRPWSYVAVNGGYLTVALVLMGAILRGVEVIRLLISESNERIYFGRAPCRNDAGCHRHQA